MFKLMAQGLLLGSLLATSSFAAAKIPGNIAVHIAKTHYVHATQLLHPYYNVWHTKGPLAEKAAMPVLQSQFENAYECKQDSQADVVLLLEPHMFYNPQSQIFYAKYIAQAYTSDGQPITSIEQEAWQLGNITVNADFYMEKGYQKAIDKVVAALSSDQAFLATLNQSQQVKAGDLCYKLDNLPQNRLYY